MVHRCCDNPCDPAVIPSCINCLTTPPDVVSVNFDYVDFFSNLPVGPSTIDFDIVSQAGVSLNPGECLQNKNQIETDEDGVFYVYNFPQCPNLNPRKYQLISTIKQTNSSFIAPFTHFIIGGANRYFHSYYLNAKGCRGQDVPNHGGFLCTPSDIPMPSYYTQAADNDTFPVVPFPRYAVTKAFFPGGCEPYEIGEYIGVQCQSPDTRTIWNGVNGGYSSISSSHVTFIEEILSTHMTEGFTGPSRCCKCCDNCEGDAVTICASSAPPCDALDCDPDECIAGDYDANNSIYLYIPGQSSAGNGFFVCKNGLEFYDFSTYNTGPYIVNPGSPINTTCGFHISDYCSTPFIFGAAPCFVKYISGVFDSELGSWNYHVGNYPRIKNNLTIAPNTIYPELSPNLATTVGPPLGSAPDENGNVNSIGYCFYFKPRSTICKVVHDFDIPNQEDDDSDMFSNIQIKMTLGHMFTNFPADTFVNQNTSAANATCFSSGIYINSTNSQYGSLINSLPFDQYGRSVIQTGTIGREWDGVNGNQRRTIVDQVGPISISSVGIEIERSLDFQKRNPILAVRYYINDALVDEYDYPPPGFGANRLTQTAGGGICDNVPLQVVIQFIRDTSGLFKNSIKYGTENDGVTLFTIDNGIRNTCTNDTISHLSTTTVGDISKYRDIGNLANSQPITMYAPIITWS